MHKNTKIFFVNPKTFGKLLDNFFFKNDQFQTHIKRKTTTIKFYVNENFHNIFEQFFFRND